MNTPWQVYAAAVGFDPAPITAWLVLIVALFTVIAGVCTFIAFGWRYIALPQIKELIDLRIDLSDKSVHASFRNVHQRVDAHIHDHH
jgi:hypothetical protein